MRQVVALAARGSFVKAAAELGVAQPTLSKSIARLEDQLGLKLFDRSGGGAAPTPAGRFIVERAGEIIAAAARLGREVELVSGGQVGALAVGVSTGMGAVFLPRLALALNARYPALGLRLVSGERAWLLERVAAGQLDLLILIDEQDLDDLGLQRVEIRRQRIVAVAGPDHPLAGRRNLTQAEFVAWPGVAGSATAMFGPGAMLGLAAAGADRSAHFVTTDYGVASALVAIGAATCVGPEHLFADDLAAGRCVRLDLAAAREVTIVAAATRPAMHSPLVAEVIAIAAALGRELGGDAPGNEAQRRS